MSEASEVYLGQRKAEISASTVRLETDALKSPLRILGEQYIGNFDAQTFAHYIAARKHEGIANRTINIETGVLRRILKVYKLWQFVADGVKPLSESKEIGRTLSPEQEAKLFSVASSRPEWGVAFCASLIAANTTAQGCELRNLRLQDVDFRTRALFVKVDKNRFRVRAMPLNQTATWAILQLLERAQGLGARHPEHYLIPSRVEGKRYDPTQPPSRWAWRTAWSKLTVKADLPGLRPHDLRHHAITKLAESQASEQTIMAIAGHVSREMLEHYSHIRLEAKSPRITG